MNEKLRMPLKIHLLGPAVERHRLPLDQLTLFAGQLQVAVHRIGRILSGEAFSLIPGPVPKDVKEACTLEIVAINSGSLSLVCDLPLEMVQSKPEQLMLFDELSSDAKTALGERSLTAFVQGIAQVGDAKSQLPHGFDKGVLLALREGGKLFSLGIDVIDFELQCRSENTNTIKTSFTPQVHERIIARIQDPVTNKATIQGRLLMGDFRDSGYSCRIHPSVGRPIRCTFGDEQREAVLAAMTRYVRLVGQTFEVDNEIKNFKIEDIEILETEQFASGQEFHPFFDGQIELDSLASEQGIPDSINFDDLRADFWPTDEKEDEFLQAVRGWRQEDVPDAS